MLEDIRKLVAVQLGQRDVHDTDRIIEDLGAESADFVNIIATVEEKYDIIIDERDIAGIITIADLTAVLEKNLPQL